MLSSLGGHVSLWDNKSNFRMDEIKAMPEQKCHISQQRILISILQILAELSTKF